jgi:nucleoid-associated protein YgaU
MIRVLRLAGLSCIVIAALSGCASTPGAGSDAASAGAPSPLELARADVREAQAAGYAVDDALIFLRRAEQAAAEGDDEAAATAATAAQQARQAVAARKAIEAARPEVERANREAGPLASDAGKLLDAAEAALKAGDPVRAAELAAQASRQAAEAVEQQKSQAAREARERASRYQVVRGDSLWSIAGKPRVYGDSLLWPLLFRSNREQIKDADLIFPGQSLAIDRSPAVSEKKAAVRHARTRGPWKHGAREASDRAWLAR